MVQRSKVKVTRRFNALTVNAHIFRTGRPTKSNLVYRRSTKTRISDKRRDLKGQGRKVMWRVWQVLADKSRTKQTPKLVGRLPTSRATMPTSFTVKVQRSRSHVNNILHNNTSFRTTIAFYPHSLGGDTSTITLPPRFIVIRYSLGGDTNNSNTAWVRTLWVHSNFSFMSISVVGSQAVSRI